MRLKRKIYVTQTFLPPRAELDRYIDIIYDNHQLTNKGPLHEELEQKLRSFLNVKHLHCVGNATLALQLAMRALQITEGDVITTPFSYAATVTSIIWERCTPVFADIRADTLTLDPAKVEQAITARTRAIMPVHVFGYACAVDDLQKIADTHGLKIIYDAAHVFGAKYKGKSLLDYGDVSVCSMHATKHFHTAEGGFCVSREEDVSSRIELLRRFGHNNNDHYMAGINAKLSEPHAAIGLANFKHLPEIFEARKQITARYNARLSNKLQRHNQQEGLEPNYAYYPVQFASEAQLLHVFNVLEQLGVYPKRYFYPALNTLPYLEHKADCPVAEDIASRSACLPLFYGLEDYEIDLICDTINSSI